MARPEQHRHKIVGEGQKKLGKGEGFFGDDGTTPAKGDSLGFAQDTLAGQDSDRRAILDMAQLSIERAVNRGVPRAEAERKYGIPEGQDPLEWW